MTTLLFALVALAVVLNAYAAVVLVRSPRYDSRQKRFQLGIVWLLPLAGAILVWSLAHDPRHLWTTINLGSGHDDGHVRPENYSSGEGGHDGGGGGDGGGD